MPHTILKMYLDHLRGDSGEYTIKSMDIPMRDKLRVHQVSDNDGGCTFIITRDRGIDGIDVFTLDQTPTMGESIEAVRNAVKQGG